jgi:hypothetical protein
MFLLCNFVESVKLKTINVDVIGVDPPCARCKKTKENAQKAAAKIQSEKVKVEITVLTAASKETIAKYGVVVPPAIAMNGIVKIMGKEPDAGVIERLLRKEL